MNDLNLNNQLKKEDFVKKTILQIEKDFDRCNIKINLPVIPNLEILENAILLSIQSLSREKIQQLIYLIDIPEKEYSKLVKTEFFYRALSEKILRREALKVFLRENLSV